MNASRRHVAWAVTALAILVVAGAIAEWRTEAAVTSPAPVLASQQGSPIHVRGRKYSYSPSRIEVQEGDLVTIRFEAEDIPHSFTIDDDAYRIAKRAAPGQPVTFEFRAGKVGSFTFYCNLTADDGCRDMRGVLVVRAKK